MPTVSVIIPTYNHADTLRRAIDSVLAQTFEDFELFVVDDASTDETPEIITSYEDERVHYLAHEENQGGSAARNTGIEHATGEFIAFLDSDDEWLPEKLEKQVACLRERDENWAAVYTDAHFVLSGNAGTFRNKVGRWLMSSSDVNHREGGEELIKDILTDRLHTHAGSSLLARAEAVYEIDGFDESFQRFQDPEFLIRLLEVGDLACVDEPLLIRYDPDRTPPASVIEEADRHFMQTFADRIERLERQGHDITGAHHFSLAKLFFRDGEFGKGLQYLIWSRMDDPYRYFGLLWAMWMGMYRRWKSALPSPPVESRARRT